MFTKFFKTLHKILGIPLSVIFVMWFISGIFMVFYSSFPRMPLHAPNINYVKGALLSTDTLIKLSGLTPDSVTSFRYETDRDNTIVEITAPGKNSTLLASDGMPYERVKMTPEETVGMWCDAPVEKIDTLTNLDQWIPFERNEERLPIYKYHFKDDDRHQLYITKDGDVIQFTDRKQRLKSWFSTIPHWIYFTSLRKHQKAWISAVSWCAILGCIMCLAGIILAVIMWWRHGRKISFWHCPYRRPLWRWHFVLGMLFGWCAITFAFSGYMSLAPLPGFLVKERSEKKDLGDGSRRERSKDNHPGGFGGFGMTRMSNPKNYLLDINKMTDVSDSIISISLKEWEGYPYYAVTTPAATRNIDASEENEVKEFILTEEMVEKVSLKKFPGIHPVVEKINEYDSDYFSLNGKRTPLPVIRVTYPGDELNTKEYYNPETLTCRTFDDNRRLHNLLYGGLHNLHLKFLTDHRWLWWSVMTILLLGGTALSITGLLLALKWLIRQFRRAMR